MTDFNRLRRSMNQIMNDFMDTSGPTGFGGGYSGLGGFGPFGYGRGGGFLQDPFWTDDFSVFTPPVLLPLTADIPQQQLTSGGTADTGDAKVDDQGQAQGQQSTALSSRPNEQRLGLSSQLARPLRVPRINVEERADKIVVSAEVPGLKKEEINLNLDANTRVLSISGQKSEERKEEDKNKTYLRVERSESSFQRSLKLPDNIDPQAVVAKYENGILHVEVPKKPEEANKQNKIAIE